MEDLLWWKAFEAAQNGQKYAFATIIESTIKGTPRKTGAKMIVWEDGSSWGSIGGGRNEKRAQQECLQAIKVRKPKTVTYKFDEAPGNSICGGQIKVFIEPFSGKKRFIICGAGHIALPLSALAKMLNFRVLIIDDRKDLANSKRFPHADHILIGDHAKVLKKQKITPQDHIFMVTQGYEHDYNCLKIALKTKAAYVGFISSKVKKVKFIRRLRKDGFSETLIQKIRAPMGLNLGAQTPEEIAISIAAEIIALEHGVWGSTLKYDYKY